MDEGDGARMGDGCRLTTMMMMGVVAGALRMLGLLVLLESGDPALRVSVG